MRPATTAAIASPLLGERENPQRRGPFPIGDAAQIVTAARLGPIMGRGGEGFPALFVAS